MSNAGGERETERERKREGEAEGETGRQADIQSALPLDHVV